MQTFLKLLHWWLTKQTFQIMSEIIFSILKKWDDSRKYLIEKYLHYVINPFHITGLTLFFLKTSGNMRHYWAQSFSTYANFSEKLTLLNVSVRIRG